MIPEALEELDSLPLLAQLRQDVLELRVMIFMKAKRWKEAAAASEKLCAVAPELPLGFIHSAFCLHEMGKTREAKEVLLEGPAALVKEATYHYNLACYECALGNTEAAQAYLQTSINMDERFEAYAKTDPDLKALKF